MGNSLQQARANLQHLRDAVQSFLLVRVTCLLLAHGVGGLRTRSWRRRDGQLTHLLRARRVP